MSLEVGKLVVSPAHRELGVGRLERFLRAPGQPREEPARFARVFFYEPGRFEVLERTEVEPAPPGVWRKR